MFNVLRVSFDSKPFDIAALDVRKAVKAEVNNPSKDLGSTRFGVKYKKVIDGDSNKFYEALKVKARMAHHFVPNITRCEVVEENGEGFLRRVELKSTQSSIDEDVRINDQSRQILFKMRERDFLASNEVKQSKKDQHYYFVGRYIMDNPHTTARKFSETMDIIYSNLANYQSDKKA